MKNQNDIIGIIVAVLIAAIGIGVIFATKPADKAKETVTAVDTQEVTTPASSVVMVNNLPGGGSSQSSGMGSLSGGRSGMMGPMGPMGPGGMGSMGGKTLPGAMSPMSPMGGAGPMAPAGKGLGK